MADKQLPKIVLASASPRRSQILGSLGIPFSAFPVNVIESPLDGELPVAMALRLSEAKAQAAKEQFPDSLIIAADTIVVKGDYILGKPVDADDALRMLTLLSGAEHSVITAISIAFDQLHSDYCETSVSFHKLTEEEIRWYIATGEPMDKAGGYGIQGYASIFIERISGSYSNVVGLPVRLLEELLQNFGYSIRDFINNDKDSI